VRSLDLSVNNLGMKALSLVEAALGARGTQTLALTLTLTWMSSRFIYP
jgi:hypothetical protein